jgi:galactose-1-phosphate uridylyltransferase
MAESSHKRSSKCIFCEIVDEKVPATKIIFENDNILIFNDIKPASEFHYLAIPKVHIDNPKCLNVSHREIGNLCDVLFGYNFLIITNIFFAVQF